MRWLVLTALLVCAGGAALAEEPQKCDEPQKCEKCTKGDKIENVMYTSIDIYASFPGGRDGLTTFLSENINYPEKARLAGVQGRVLLDLIVERDGSVSDVTVLRSVDPELDAEAVRVCKMMPKFMPAVNAETDEPIRVKYTLPVTFRLE